MREAGWEAGGRGDKVKEGFKDLKDARWVTFVITESYKDLESMQAATIICMRDSCEDHSGKELCRNEAPGFVIAPDGVCRCVSYAGRG